MRSFAFISLMFLIACSWTACGKKQDPDRTPIEEVVISEPPEYEVPEPPKPTIGEDGVWLADEALLYGAPQPVQREILSCDPHRRCDFVVKMDYRQVRAFLDKYFPYQPYKYFKAVDLFEVYPEIKPEFKEGGVVPSLDKRIKRPEPGQEVKIVISWIRKYNTYVWHYTSAFAIHEEEARVRAEQEAFQREAAEYIKRIIETNTIEVRTEHDSVMLERLDIVLDENNRVRPEDIERLKIWIQEQTTEKNNDDGMLPSLDHVDDLATLHAQQQNSNPPAARPQEDALPPAQIKPQDDKPQRMLIKPQKGDVPSELLMPLNDDNAAKDNQPDNPPAQKDAGIIPSLNHVDF